MALEISVEQVMAFAPDASSAKSGKDLSNPRKWVSLGCNDDAAWGLCQGSGSSPYQTKANLSDASAVSCSCPSRKFPCKHGLGLLLIYAGQRSAMTQTEPPAWVQDWLANRAKKAEAKVEKQKKKEEAATDPAVQAKQAADVAKRAAERHKKVAAGLEELDLWLRDLIRQGFANLPSGDYDYWDKRATRLVDAQCRGAARIVKELASIPAKGEGWQSLLLEELSRLHLLTEGYKRLDQLPKEVYDELLGTLDSAFRDDKANLYLKYPAIADNWVVLGQRVEVDEDKIKGQWTWLWGSSTNKPALHLEFKRVPTAMENSFLIGSALDAEFTYYPSSLPLRAEIKTKQNVSMRPVNQAPPGFPSVDAALTAYGQALGQNPWMGRYPLCIHNVVPQRQGENWRLRDGDHGILPLASQFQQGWKLLALSGGRPIVTFGEFDGHSYLPLTVWGENRMLNVSVSPSAS